MRDFGRAILARRAREKARRPPDNSAEGEQQHWVLNETPRFRSGPAWETALIHRNARVSSPSRLPADLA